MSTECISPGSCRVVVVHARYNTFSSVTRLFSSRSLFFSAAAGTGACDRGAAAKGGLLEYDPGPQPPSHGTQCALCRGGVPRRVAPAPQQGVPGRKQAGQCRPAQRLVVMEC